jgi:hypothetical protein
MTAVDVLCVAAGVYRPKVYRQFKMYNDPQYRRQSGV